MEEHARDKSVDKLNLYTVEGLCFMGKYVPKVLLKQTFHRGGKNKRNPQNQTKTKNKHLWNKPCQRIILTQVQKCMLCLLGFEKLYSGVAHSDIKSRF